MWKRIGLLSAFLVMTSCSGKKEEISAERVIYMDSTESNVGIDLEGVSSFVFIPGFFAEDAKQADQIYELLKKDLSRLGQVTTVCLLKTKNQENVVNLEGFTGPILQYSLQELVSLEGRTLGIMKATLTLDASVQMTKKQMQVPIWTKSCFVKALSKPIEEVALTFDFLMQDFYKDYSSVNKEKPLFRFCSPLQ